MLEQVEWGEFKLGDLFDIQNTLSFNKDKLTCGNEYDYITRTSLNQGILQCTGFVNKTNINESGTWSLGLLQMDFFYRNKPWYAGQFVRKIIPKFELSKNNILYFSTILNAQKQILLSVLVRDVDDIFCNLKIELPIKNGKIDFEFMDKFIAELEKIQQAEINSYLEVTGLKNYALTNDELKVLKDFEDGKMEWKEFKVENLFDILPIHQKLSKKNVEKNGTVPIYSSDSSNNGIIGYCNQQPTYLINETITFYNIFGDHTKTMNIAKESFCIMDNVKVLKPKGQSIRQILFVNTVRKKQIPDLGYARHRSKAREVNIPLPIKNNEIDYDLMENFISAVHKLVIKDLVLYNQERLKATAQVINKKP